MKPYSTLFCLAVCPFATQAALVINSYPANPGCGASNGSISISVAGGLPPYTYAWADGPITEDRTGLAAGSYTLTVTDAAMETEVENFTLVETLPASADMYITYAGGFECPGMQNGSFIVFVESLTYTVEVTVNGSPLPSSGTDIMGNPMFSGVATGDGVSYTITDANGCTGGDSFIVYGPLGIEPSIVDLQPACGTEGGSVRIVPDPSDWLIDLTVFDNSMQVIAEVPASAEALQLNDLAPGDYQVYVSYNWSMNNGCTPFIIPFTIADLGPDCGTISGTSWYDSDADCVYDANEVPIRFSTLTIQPGDQQVITDVDGTYQYAIVNGNYTLAQNDATLDPLCPPVMPVPFTMATNTQTIDLANGSTVPLDLVLAGSQGAARPGFNYGIWCSVSNTTPQVSGPITMVYTFDPQLTFTSANPAPASVVGNVITWELAALGSFGYTSLSASLGVPAALPLGTALSGGIIASNTLSESSTANNSATFNTIVTGSYDPNDKVAVTSSGASEDLYFIDEDEWIDYTIRFQNTGTDTAFTVVVTDTLSEVLDMASFEQGVASHPFHVAFKPGRVVLWTFEDILLPDSNVNEMASHGLVGFRIKPLEPLVPGTVIENIANIFFDYNEPVITEPSVLVAEFSTGLPELHANGLSISPNPAKDHVVLSLADQGVIAEVRLFSVDGRMVKRHPKALGRVELDLDGLVAGTYLVAVRTNGGNWLQGHFAKE